MSFRQIPFTQLLSKIIDNRGKTCPVGEAGIPLIATNCVKNSSLYPLFEKVRYVNDEVYNTWFREHPKPEDILFVTKGSPGNNAWVPDPVSFCIAQDMVALRANRKIVDPKFLLALLRSEKVQNDISNLHVGTLIPHFKKGDFDKLVLSIPEDMDLQKKVGKIYFDISLKIEKNNQINQTLETIAQTLFKSWFVDFDPVKAKIAAKVQGQDPQLAAMRAISGKTAEQIAQLPEDKRNELAATADLFPDDMVESELGMIPKGWKVEPLDKVADFLNGLALQRYPAKNSETFLPVIKIVQLKKGDVKGAEKASKDIPKDYIIDNGDVVFSWSGSLFTDVWCGGKGALNQHLFKVTSVNYPKWFYYQWIILHLPEFIRIAADKAVTMGHIKREHLTQAMCIVPDEILIRKADIIFSNLLEMYINKKVESLKLAETRDILLPKLLSGELNL